MAPRYVGQYSAKVPEVFKYSSDTDHEKTHATLSTKCKEMKLRSQLLYEFVSSILPSTTDLQSVQKWIITV